MQKCYIINLGIIKCSNQSLNLYLSRSLCLYAVSAWASALVYFNHSHCSALTPHGAGTIVAWGPRLIIVYRTLMKSPKAHAVIHMCICMCEFVYVCVYLYICLRQDINTNLYTIRRRDAWSTCDKQRERERRERWRRENNRMGEMWSETTHSPQPIRLTLIDLNKRAHIYQISRKNRRGREQDIVPCTGEPHRQGNPLPSTFWIRHWLLWNMYMLVCLLTTCMCKCLCISANTKCQQLIKQHLLVCKGMNGMRRGESISSLPEGAVLYEMKMNLLRSAAQ